MNNFLMFLFAVELVFLFVSIFIGFVAKSQGVRIFTGEWSEVSVGEILLAFLIFPSFLALVFIESLSYKPFKKRNK